MKKTSLKERLLLIILATSGLCVFITTLAITIYGLYNMRGKMVNDLQHSTELRADRLYTFINNASENNRNTITTILNTTSSDEEVKICVYYASDIQPENTYYELTHHIRDNSKEKCPPIKEVMDNAARKNNTFYDGNRLKSYMPSNSRTEPKTRAGYIYVESDLGELTRFIKEQVLTAFLIMLGVLVLSYFVAQMLQRSISGPILKLVDTTKKVSMERDYTIRAENFLEGDDIKRNEISVLIDAFNNMLNEVEGRRKLLLRKNQELVKSKEIAESANRAKSQFLANISHELRTPLNAVIGFSDLIRNEILGPIEDTRYVEYAKDINESGEHLLHIINDILDLSKAEAGKLEPVLREISLKKNIEECVTYVAKRAADNSILIKTEIPDNMPNLIVDRVMFKRIIANLLSNSVKFTNRGGIIRIGASVKLSNRNENIFTITIEDTGIGMTKDDIERAFKSFVQLDSGLDRKYEGTGLGLPLTKKLIELHGGNIEMVSKVGEGTKAIVKFYSPINPS